MPTSFEAYRRLVLKELTKVKIYKNFHVCVKAFNEVGGIDKFAESLLPLLKSMWQLERSIEWAAQRLDTLTQANMMQGMLLVAEEKHDRRGK